MLSLPPIVAAGAVVDSLGREWDPLKHPRGRDGKFIHTFKRIRAFLDAANTDPWMTGEVTKINNDGSIRVRIKKTTDPNLVDPSSGKSYADQEVDITPDLVESINEKAVLNLDGTTPTVPKPAAFSSMGYGDEMETWKSFRNRFFPDVTTGATLGKVDLDNTVREIRDVLNSGGDIEAWEADYKERGGHDFVRDAAKYMIATRVMSRSDMLGDNGAKEIQHSNEKFRAVLEQLGVDPDVIDDTPDGLSGFDDLAGKMRAWKNALTGFDFAPRTPGAVRELEFGDHGYRVAMFGKDFGGPDSPVSYKVVDKDGNIDPRSFNSYGEAREAAIEAVPSASPSANAPEPPPEPEELVDEFDAPEADGPSDADLAEIEDASTEQFTDIDVTDVRDLGQEISMSEDTEYGDAYSSSIIGIANGVEEGSYTVEDARSELRSLAEEIEDEADDFDNPSLKKFAKNLRAAADNLGVTNKAELPESDDVEEEPVDVELPDTIVNNPLDDSKFYKLDLEADDFLPENQEEWFAAAKQHGVFIEDFYDDENGNRVIMSGQGSQFNDFMAKNSALEFVDPNDYDTSKSAASETIDDVPKVSTDEKNASDWTPEQIEVFQEYVEASQDLNDTLRYETDDDSVFVGTLKHYTDIMDSAINKYLLPEDTKLYRGLNFSEDQDSVEDFVASLQPGKTVRDRAYMSTTSDIDVANKFVSNDDNDQPGVFIEISAKKGHAALPIDAVPVDWPEDESESEMILPRNSRLYIESREVDENGVTRIKARLLSVGEAEPTATEKIDTPAGAIDQSDEVAPEEEYVGPLTEKQAKHFMNYTGMGARKLNKILRGNQSGDLNDIPGDASFKMYETEGAEDISVHDMTETLDDLVESAPEVGTYKALYRGMVVDTENDSDFLASLVPGAVINDKGFMSTSTNPDVAESFAGDLDVYETKKTVVFSLSVSEGMHAINVDSLASQIPGAYEMNEQEFLFGRNVQTEIEDVQLDNNGNYTVIAKLLPPGTKNDSQEEGPTQDGTADTPSSEEAPGGAPDVDAGPGDGNSSPEVDTPPDADVTPEGGQDTSEPYDPWAELVPGDPYAPADADDPDEIDIAIEEEPLAEWEKELLYGDDYVPPSSAPDLPINQETGLPEWEKALLEGDAQQAENDGQIVPFTEDDNLPGPDSEDWENMVDGKGAYRWDQDGNKIRVGDKVVGADGVEMTISKFENNNKGVIALDAENKKRIRHRKKLTLVPAEDSAPLPTPEPDPTPAPDDTPTSSDLPGKTDTFPTGAYVDGANWKSNPKDFDFAFQSFVNSAADGNVDSNDYFYAGDGYHITFDQKEQEYSLWSVTQNEDGSESYDYVDGFAASNNFPVHDDISDQIIETISARENLINPDNDPVPPSTTEENLKLSTVDWNDQAALSGTVKDVLDVVKNGGWPWSSSSYVDLGEGYSLRFDKTDGVFEVHVDATGEILMPPVGGPNSDVDTMTNNVQNSIKKYKQNPYGAPKIQYGSNPDDFDTAIGNMLEDISNEEYNDGDKVSYDGYDVEFNRITGKLVVSSGSSGEKLVEVDIDEDFDTMVDSMHTAMYKDAVAGPVPDAPNPTQDDDTSPSPVGTMSLFSSWENSAETFAYDFAGFENDVMDGNTEPNDYFDAGDGYNVTNDAMNEEWALWNLDKDPKPIAKFAKTGDSADEIQSFIKKLESGDDSVAADVPSSTPASTQVYDSNAELDKINDIPKNLPGVKSLFPGIGPYAATQYRNAGYALDDAKKYEVDSPEWNQVVNKAIYNLTQSGAFGQSKLAQVSKWRTDTINAHNGGVIESDTPISDIKLPLGYAPAPDAIKIYETINGSPTLAVVSSDGSVTYHYSFGGTKKMDHITDEVLKNHPSWTPFGGIEVVESSTVTPGPDLSQPHKMDVNGTPMFIGDKAYWSTKGIEVTITGFENNDVGVLVKSIGPDGKPKKHALNRKKLKLVSSTQHANSQAPNKAGSPPSVVDTGLKSKKVDPDPSSPWFGKPQPVKPDLEVVESLEGQKLVDDSWLEKANENYKKGAKAENPNWIEKELSQSLTYQEYTSAQKGNKNSLNSLLSKGWITPEMHADALAQIDKNNAKYEEALAKNNEKLAAWRKDVKAWRAANGLPSIELKGMTEGVLKFNNKDAIAWMHAHQKPGSLTPAGMLTGQSAAGIESQKGSNISGTLRNGREKTLDPQWIADNASYAVIGADQAMLDSPPLAEDFMVTRTLDMPNFIDPATGQPYQHGGSLSNLAGTIQHDWGFAETSVGSYDAGATVGYGSGRAIRMQLRVPKGTRGVWTNHPSQNFGYESERGFLLERGLAYYIHSVNWTGSYWAVDAEVIPKSVNYDEFGHFINENPFFD